MFLWSLWLVVLLGQLFRFSDAWCLVVLCREVCDFLGIDYLD